MRNAGYIELDRRFFQIPEGSERDAWLKELELLAYVPGTSSNLDWSALLRKRRTVVLGEPGSGKTKEFKNRSTQLAGAGCNAFFIDLRDLVGNRLWTVLDRQDQLGRFETWQTTRESAWFFLDAVDESRLGHPDDFRTALENFSRDLTPEHRNRAHILLSSRISSWRPQADLLLIDSLLALDSPDESETIRLRRPDSPVDSVGAVEAHTLGEDESGEDRERTNVVALLPLNLDQIEIFANRWGEHGKKFREAIVSHFIEPLARRPLDVENLLRYWHDNAGFGSYFEMLEYSVTQGLKEPSGNAARDILSPAKVRRGSETLAAMVLFCRRRDIAISQEPSEHLQPRTALPNEMSNQEVASLLDRALFDAPLYGCVRFHHREMEEYLTARWLERLHSRNLPLHTMKALLFEDIEGEPLILRQTLAPVAAWYACFGTEEAKHVRQWLLKAEPEVFFRAGDPSQLTAEYRRSILDALIENYRGWGFTRIDVDAAALSRLADPALADYFASKVTDQTVSEDLRGKFFYMAEVSRLSGLQNSAMAVLLSEDESSYLREAACDYLSALSDQEGLTRLAASLEAIGTLTDSLVVSLLIALVPRHISNKDAASLLLRLGGIEEFSTAFQFTLLNHCKDECSPKEVIQFLSIFNDLLTYGPPWYREGQEEYRVSSRFVGLGDVSLQLLPIVLGQSALTDTETAIVAQAAWLVLYLSRFGTIHNLDRVDLKELLVAHERVGKRYLDYSLEVHRQAHGTLEGAEWLFVSAVSTPILQYRDAWWILDKAEEADEATATLLLRIVEALWAEYGYSRTIRRRARLLIGRKTIYKTDRVPRFPGWLLRKWYAWRGAYRRTIGHGYWWRRRVREAKKKLQWLRNQWQLLRLLPQITRGDHKGALWFLLNELKDTTSSRLARSGWEGLRANRGQLIEVAAKKGVIAYWPRFVPTLRHERPDGNRSMDAGVIIGLTGIQEALNGDQLNFSSITDAQIRQLTRYALNEINGFPGWFQKLSVTRPSPVRHVVMSAIEHEWQITAEQETVHGVIAALSYDQTGAHNEFVGPVLEKLTSTDPAHPTVLSQVLRLTLRDPAKSAVALVDLAKNRTHDYSREANQHLDWMSTLLKLDASSALDQIEIGLSEIDDRNGYMASLLSAIAPDRRMHSPGITTPSYCEPDHLYRLILLSFEHLAPTPDRNVDDSVVTSLDEAMRCRDGFITQLGASKSERARYLLGSLLDRPQLRSHHDWIRHLLLTGRRAMATNEPWTEHQIRMFEEQHLVAPSNPRDLFRLTCDRLQEIKDWVETGDDSPRGELHVDSRERDVRIWVARKLKERSREQYVVPEENELASGSRQDIRVEAPNVPGHVVIEVKQVEGWSYDKLKERLQNQLVGQYLRSQNAGFGVYLISYNNRGGMGSGCIDPVSKTRLTVTELVENLQKFANELKEDEQGFEEIKVMSIDFVTDRRRRATR